MSQAPRDQRQLCPTATLWSLFAVIPCPIPQQPPAFFSLFFMSRAAGPCPGTTSGRRAEVPALGMGKSQTPLPQQRGKLSQQTRAHVLMEPLICWKYCLKLSTALSNWVDTTGFWVYTKGFNVNTSCEVGTARGSSRSCSWHTLHSVGIGAPSISPALPKRWNPQAELDPASPSSPEHHIKVPSVPKEFSVSPVVIRFHTCLLRFIFIHCSVYNTPHS